MFYSVLVEISEGSGKNKSTSSIIESDHPDLEKIKLDILIPYFQGKEFFMDGYRINPEKISRIKIVSSENSIKNLVNFKNEERHRKNMLSDIIILGSYNEYQIIHDEELVNDITNEILKEVKKGMAQSKITTAENKDSVIDNKRVFIVHGHDDRIKWAVSNFLRKLGLEPVILHEQTNQGKTIIEKLESETDVGYGIVLYTPCDKGGTIDCNFENMRFRARQNVILEHGYLMGKLGRNRVCALLDGDIERPSDIDGILYVPYKPGWELTVGKELRSAGYDVDLNIL